MTSELENRTIALLVAPRGTEEPEFTDPRQAAEDAGARVVAISTEGGEAQTVNSDLDPGGTYGVDATFAESDPADYDALILPGGTVGTDTLRGESEAVAFVKAFFDAGKPVAAICHAPWLLVEAGVVAGRTLTSYPTLQTDIRNAGGEWTDEEVVIDAQDGDGTASRLVTSRTPDDLPAFCEALVEQFAKGASEAAPAA